MPYEQSKNPSKYTGGEDGSVQEINLQKAGNVRLIDNSANPGNISRCEGTQEAPADCD